MCCNDIFLVLILYGIAFGIEKIVHGQGSQGSRKHNQIRISLGSIISVYSNLTDCILQISLFIIKRKFSMNPRCEAGLVPSLFSIPLQSLDCRALRTKHIADSGLVCESSGRHQKLSFLIEMEGGLVVDFHPLSKCRNGQLIWICSSTLFFGSEEFDIDCGTCGKGLISLERKENFRFFPFSIGLSHTCIHKL